jgi:arginine exporter protein ArgO
LRADTWGGELSPTVLHSCEVVIGLVLLGIAAVGLLRTEEARVAVSRIRRPAPTLLAINLCNPMALASWAGLIFALPDSLRESGSLLPFTIGVVIASAVWHSMLASLRERWVAGWLSPAGAGSYGSPAWPSGSSAWCSSHNRASG